MIPATVLQCTGHKVPIRWLHGMQSQYRRHTASCSRSLGVANNINSVQDQFLHRHLLNRPGFDAAVFFEEDSEYAQRFSPLKSVLVQSVWCCIDCRTIHLWMPLARRWLRNSALALSRCAGGLSRPKLMPV